MEFEKKIRKIEDQAKEDWNFELEWLRNKKDNEPPHNTRYIL